MDSTKNGIVGRITIIATILSICVIVLGGIWDLANTINDINSNIINNGNKIDRNCRIMARNTLLIELHFYDNSLSKREREALSSNTSDTQC